LVAGRAEISVLAGSSHREVRAGTIGGTQIFGTDVIVITVHGYARLADADDADVVHGAWISIVAPPFDIFMGTAAVGITDVKSTAIAVIAEQAPLADTRSRDAQVVAGAGAMIITGIDIIDVLTAGGRSAAIVRAGIAVVAEQGGTGVTATSYAGVAYRARIAIAAGNRIGDMLATFAGITAVICTGVSIVAGEITAAHTYAIKTLITAGTGVLVVTGCKIGRVHAALNQVAGIVGAGILVVTVQAARADAYCVDTMVKGGAGVPIRAGVIIGFVLATSRWIAAVRSAWVCVVAIIEVRAGSADAGDTEVTERTGIPIIAGIVGEFVETAHQRFTPVGRTGIVIIAIERRLRGTDPLNTLVQNAA